MPLLIDRQIAENHWTRVESAEVSNPSILNNKNVLVPLTLVEGIDLNRKIKQLGLFLESDVEISEVLPWLPKARLIAINFTTFRDGRGFSLARQIRRLGYAGELRAVGYFARDQLAYLERCGFNAFDISGAQEADELIKAFTEITVRYQGSADDPRPLYRQPSLPGGS